MGCMEEAGEALGSVLEIVVVPLRSHDWWSSSRKKGIPIRFSMAFDRNFPNLSSRTSPQFPFIWRAVIRALAKLWWDWMARRIPFRKTWQCSGTIQALQVSSTHCMSAALIVPCISDEHILLCQDSSNCRIVGRWCFLFHRTLPSPIETLCSQCLASCQSLSTITFELNSRLKHLESEASHAVFKDHF
jgi:hypothetical protein